MIPQNAQQQSAAEVIADLCQAFDLALMYVFGSQAKAVYEWAVLGKPLAIEPGHDVDVGVKSLPGHQLTVWQKVAAAQTLESLFDVSRVDLVDMEDVDPFLAANIIRGERLYAADSYVADEYDLYVLRRAGDLAPFAPERIMSTLVTYELFNPSRMFSHRQTI